MQRVFFAILISLGTLAIVAQSMLIYQVSAAMSIVAEEEAPDDSPVYKKVNELSKESIGTSLYLFRPIDTRTLSKAIHDNAFRCSKGFCATPYNPPDNSGVC